MASEDIKLTEFSHGAGCGCKISPKLLKEIKTLGQRWKVKRKDLLNFWSVY